MTNLDGLTMFVSATADAGVVNSDTRLHFIQRGSRVAARYAGGRVTRGWLVGKWVEGLLHFRYAQCDDHSCIHGGKSVGAVEQLPDGRVRLIEQFTWTTRPGSGINVFDEWPSAS